MTTRELPADRAGPADAGAGSGARRPRSALGRVGRPETAAHGERLATALHDVLLAVRELCSFALEHDGRWSSANNQRKYRVSQLYSSLLDTIRSDALRDPAHLRTVAAAATAWRATRARVCSARF